MPIFSAVLFFVAGAGTPGPNNTIAMASAAAFGFRRTIPIVAGVSIGFPLMLVLVGVGLGGVLAQWPWVLDVLRPIGILYLLWLAWRIATGPTDVKARRASSPPGFVHMVLFQFVNPKAWTLAVAALAAYTGFWDSFLLEVVVLAVLAFVATVPCTGAWALLGVGAGRLISNPLHMRVFNVVMAALLLVSLIPAARETWSSAQSLLG